MRVKGNRGVRILGRPQDGSKPPQRASQIEALIVNAGANGCKIGHEIRQHRPTLAGMGLHRRRIGRLWRLGFFDQQTLCRQTILGRWPGDWIYATSLTRFPN